MNKDERIEFSKILYGISLPDGITDAEISIRYNPLIDYMKKFLPLRLYRFRSCEERNFDALYKNQIWASNGECMNDGFDARMFYDQSEVEREIQKSLSDEALERLITILKLNNFPLEVNDKLTETLQIYRDEVLKKVQNGIGDLFTLVQKSTKFACFSEDICSSAMWGLYSNNESGFAIEYVFNSNNWNKQDENGVLETFSLYPTVYNDVRFKVPNDYIQFLIKRNIFANLIDPQMLNSLAPCPDKSMVTKISLRKSMEWEYEKEWRIIFTRKDYQFFNNKYSSFIAEPSALYLGRRISFIHELFLKEIAKEKKIPVFKMQLNDASPTYRLIYSQIQ